MLTVKLQESEEAVPVITEPDEMPQLDLCKQIQASGNPIKFLLLQEKQN